MTSSVCFIVFFKSLRMVFSFQDEKLLASEEKALNDLRWETLCHRLAAEAVRKGSGDNVTVLLIVIGDNVTDK